MPLFRTGDRLIYFVHIPKTGGSSVETALKGAGCACALQFSKKRNDAMDFSKCTPQHMHAEVYKNYFPKGFCDYAFTVVRNPFARMASEYRMKVVDGTEDAPPDVWILTALKRFGMFQYTRDNHIRPQNQFISRDVEIFRLEDGLQQPVEAACRALGLAQVPDIPHSRKSSGEKIKVSLSTVRKIVKFYRRDFKAFDYSRDDFEQYFEIQ